MAYEEEKTTVKALIRAAARAGGDYARAKNAHAAAQDAQRSEMRKWYMDLAKQEANNTIAAIQAYMPILRGKVDRMTNRDRIQAETQAKATDRQAGLQAEEDERQRVITVLQTLKTQDPDNADIYDARIAEVQTGQTGLVEAAKQEALIAEIRAREDLTDEEKVLRINAIKGVPGAAERITADIDVGKEDAIRRNEQDRFAENLRKAGFTEEEIAAYIAAPSSWQQQLLAYVTGVGDVDNLTLADINHNYRLIEIANEFRNRVKLQEMEASEGKQKIQSIIDIYQSDLPKEMQERLVDAIVGDKPLTGSASASIMQIANSFEVGTPNRRLIEGLAALVKTDAAELNVLSRIAPLLAGTTGPDDFDKDSQKFQDILEVLALNVESNIDKGEVLTKLSESQDYTAYHLPKLWEDYKAMIDAGVKSGKWEAIGEGIYRFTGDVRDPELQGFRTKIEYLVNAWVRTESGAAITPEEVDRLREFLPGAGNTLRLNVELFRSIAEISKRNGYRDYEGTVGKAWGTAIGEHQLKEIQDLLDELYKDYQPGLTEAERAAKRDLDEVDAESKEGADADR